RDPLAPADVGRITGGSATALGRETHHASSAQFRQVYAGLPSCRSGTAAHRSPTPHPISAGIAAGVGDIARWFLFCCEKGRDLLKQVRTHLLETARPVMETMIEEATRVKVLSLHHDISTVTGEEVVVFTLAGRPAFRETKKK